METIFEDKCCCLSSLPNACKSYMILIICEPSTHLYSTKHIIYLPSS